MDHFWLLEVLYLTVNTITALARLLTADTEEQISKNWNQLLIVAFSATRFLLLAFICGDTCEKVYFFMTVMRTGLINFFLGEWSSRSLGRSFGQHVGRG
jgi:hypothetical protein